MSHSSRKDEEFVRRLKETMNTETEPEMVTPNTAGAEELDYEFPLIDQFRQTNMRPSKGKRKTSQS